MAASDVKCDKKPETCLLTVKYLRLELYHSKFPDSRRAQKSLHPSNSKKASMAQPYHRSTLEMTSSVFAEFVLCEEDSTVCIGLISRVFMADKAVAGNIMTASPISDLNPLFLAAGVTLTVMSKDQGTRQIVMDEKFFLGYRKTAVKPEEVLVSVKLPFMQQNEYFFGYKQANRREDDIAIVNAGIQVQFEPSSNNIKGMRLAFGGMAPTTVMATKAMKNCIGRKWEDDLVKDMADWLADDLPLPPGSPGGMTEYRRTLCISFFYKFYLTVLMQIRQRLPGIVHSKVPASHKSATAVFQKDPTKSTQVYEEVAPGQLEQDPLGRPLTHLSADKQASGEAIYIDDIPLYE
ncbi:xanthine dehydrogenase/oxidase-like, partial [Saccostrea cucullata]|uniref:xanthine dehydrogenase/oxidase-like n=1 Tax=Saccostrea cuccullata TaxID=36930 RepID=UPI002ED5DDEB